MEITKDIYFDDSLTAGKEAKITYAGSLFQSGSNYVNIVFGFGEAWNNTTTKPMEKTENGFVANIRMRDFDTFNFCFSDENNNWDNNNYCNYTSPILPNIDESSNASNIDNTTNDANVSSIDKITNDTNASSIDNTTNDADVSSINNITNDIYTSSIDNITNDINTSNTDDTSYTSIDFGKDDSSSIDDIIEDILGNTTKQEIISNEDNNSIDEILKAISEDTLPELEALFNDLFFESLKEDEESPAPIQEISMDDNLSQELNEVDKAVENDNAELIRLFNELFEVSNEPITFDTVEEENVNDTNVNIVKEDAKNNENINIFENEPIEEVNTVSKITTEEPNLQTATFNLDDLVSDLLDPIFSSETYAEKLIEETSLFEEKELVEDEKENSLSVVDSQEFLVSPRRLGYFYRIKKRIRLALMKLAKATKNFAKQIGF